MTNKTWDTVNWGTTKIEKGISPWMANHKEPFNNIDLEWDMTEHELKVNKTEVWTQLK